MRLESPLLSADGNRYYVVGGPTAFKQFEHRGYTCSLEWVDNEPAMLIWSTRAGYDAGVFGICLSSAAKYADPSGSPTRECFIEAWRALPVLGKAQLDMECKTLVSCIILWMPDLLHMPYCPESVRIAERPKAVWDITESDQYGKTITEVTI